MATLQPKLGLDNDFDLGSDVCLFNFGKLIEGVATSSLSVEYLVEASSNGAGEAVRHVGLLSKPVDCPVEPNVFSH